MIGLICAAVIAASVAILFMIIVTQINKAQKAEERLNQKYEQEQKAKQELKDKLDTGDSDADFDNSISILHDLAGKSRNR